jgi:hypothetical protein
MRREQYTLTRWTPCGGTYGEAFESETEAVQAQQIAEYQYGDVCWVFRFDSLTNAYHDGTGFVLDRMKHGMRFYAAYQAAESNGYVRETPAFEVFVSGYLDMTKVLFPKGVLVDPEFNVIIDEEGV